MNSVTLPGATSLVTNNLSRFLSRLDRPALAAVANAAIERLDALDGDPDLEPEEDRCAAGDDCGTGPTLSSRGDGLPGDPDDTSACGEFDIDMSASPDTPMPQRISGRLRPRFGTRRA